MKKRFTLLLLALLSLAMFGCEDTGLADYNKAPTIIVEDLYTVEVNDTNFDIKELAYIEDDFDGTFKIDDSMINYNNFDINKIGTYKIEITVVDSYDATTTKEITIKVTDSISPVITLNGDSDVTILKGSTYVELGATISDNLDNNLEVLITGNVDTQKEGEYTLEYSVKDSNRNNATPVYRTVRVVSLTQALSINKDKETFDSISFKLNILNNTTFKSIDEIKLFKGSELVSSLTDTSTRIFNNLEESTNYTIEVKYSLSLENSNEQVQTTLRLNVKTIQEAELDENGLYTSKDDVALYIYLYGTLPSNYMTKSQAGGHISGIYTSTNKASIGGDRFGNYEGLLPTKSGRTFVEVDIDYTGGNRNSKRIVYSSDGFIFYTSDHYSSFKLWDPETRTWINYSKTDSIFD